MFRADRRYIAFFKPYGVLSQFTQPPDSDKKTLASFGFPAGVYPLGRLDWDSEGLLLLSDDAALNQALLHPDRRHARTYLVQVENVPNAAAVRTLEQGLLLDGVRTLRSTVKLLTEEPQLPPRPVPIRFRKNIPTCWLKLTLCEGKNRQVRRMTAAVGHPTLRLVRQSIGTLDLFKLQVQPGEWRALNRQLLMLAFADGMSAD